ncbi:MAG: MarR family transcriptional regulator [Sediminibacterium sp.]|jgi:DNA-binding MarR family transcriptional regulator|nr:MarR family transcriptional regulator [Sediminibacterium sp.]
MGIEKDIQQTNFRNEYQKLGINIMYTANWLNEKIAGILSQEDITQQQYNILRILRGADKPLSTLQIRARMLDKMSDTSRIVDRLVAKELVEKNTCPTDRRLVDVVLSKKGFVILEKLDQLNHHLDALMKGISEKDAITMNQLLDQLREVSK